MRKPKDLIQNIAINCITLHLIYSKNWGRQNVFQAIPVCPTSKGWLRWLDRKYGLETIWKSSHVFHNDLWCRKLYTSGRNFRCRHSTPHSPPQNIKIFLWIVLGEHFHLLLIGQLHCHQNLLNYPIGQLSNFLLPPFPRQVLSCFQLPFFWLTLDWLNLARGIFNVIYVSASASFSIDYNGKIIRIKRKRNNKSLSPSTITEK